MINNSHSRGIIPFLKWAGGKQWLAPSLKTVLEPIRGRYIEPFLGAASVFFTILPSKAFLSDSNEELIETYLAVKEDVDAVIRRLQQFSFTKECFYRVRQATPLSREARAARFIYLNRTCWNGLYRVNRRGKFNVPIGSFERTPDFVVANRLRNAQLALQHAKILCQDFEEACERAKEGDTVYLDPPYTVAHASNGFRRYNESVFSWRDQLRLAKVARILKDRGCSVVVSNADDPSIISLYNAFTIMRVERTSLVASELSGRRPVTELLIMNSPIV